MVEKQFGEKEMTSGASDSVHEVLVWLFLHLSLLTDQTDESTQVGFTHLVEPRFWRVSVEVIWPRPTLVYKGHINEFF